jgi:acyl-CoA thioester hydrolase
VPYSLGGVILFYINQQVGFVDTDMMGVVHHSNYFRWFEAARVAWLKQAGVSLQELMGDGFLFPISDARCSYKKPALYDDYLKIYVKMLELSRAKMIFIYQVRRDDVLLTDGYTCNVFANSKGKPVRLSNKYYQLLLKFSEAEKAAPADGML